MRFVQVCRGIIRPYPFMEMSLATTFRQFRHREKFKFKHFKSCVNQLTAMPSKVDN